MRIRERYFFVYFMSNLKRNVLYIGITANLLKRVYDDPNMAIEREKQLKKWSRKKKNALLASTNPTLKDLYQPLSSFHQIPPLVPIKSGLGRDD